MGVSLARRRRRPGAFDFRRERAGRADDGRGADRRGADGIDDEALEIGGFGGQSPRTCRQRGVEIEEGLRQGHDVDAAFVPSARAGVKQEGARLRIILPEAYEALEIVAANARAALDLDGDQAALSVED